MSRSLDLLTEACAGLPMTIRKMFGGHGFFAPNGGMFAGIVTDDEVIFKLADDQARAELEADGGRAWTYTGKDKPMTMREWIVVPQYFYDDMDTFAAWAKRAHRLVPGKLAKPRRAKAAAPRVRTSAKSASKPASKPATKKPRRR